MLSRILRYLLAAWFCAVLAGCATPTVNREVPLLGPDLSAVAKTPGNSKVLIYNHSSRLTHLLTGKVQVRLNGRGVAALEIGEYLQIEVPRGKHALQLSHWDLVSFNSMHELEVDQPSVIVEVQATAVSNFMRTHPSLPPSTQLPDDFRPVSSTP